VIHRSLSIVTSRDSRGVNAAVAGGDSIADIADLLCQSRTGGVVRNDTAELVLCADLGFTRWIVAPGTSIVFCWIAAVLVYWFTWASFLVFPSRAVILLVANEGIIDAQSTRALELTHFTLRATKVPILVRAIDAIELAIAGEVRGDASSISTIPFISSARDSGGAVTPVAVEV